MSPEEKKMAKDGEGGQGEYLNQAKNKAKK